jgi:hypothetical protein
LIEVWVFAFFLLTLIVVLSKSRFVAVGINHEAQFSPLYLAKMADSIARHLNWDMYENKKTHEKTKKYYVNKRRELDVRSIKIKLKLNEIDYNKAFSNMVLDEASIVS